MKGSETVRDLVLLMTAATTVGFVATRAKVPYTVALVLFGIAINGLGFLLSLNLNEDLLVDIFLPALLFEAAVHFPIQELRQHAPTIATLAIPGVLLAAIITALTLWFGFSTLGISESLSVGFFHFLLFGMIVAATDPVSVISLLRQLGVDRQLALIIEGESLFNDGSAIVFFAIVLEIVNSGNFDLYLTIIELIRYPIGGILIGSMLGLFASFVLSLSSDYLMAIAITTVTAYGSCIISDRYQVSGILATVVAGLFVGSKGRRGIFNTQARLAVTSFWEYIAFFVSSIVFLMMGLQVDVTLILNNIPAIVVAYLAVLSARAVSVYLSVPILKQMGQPLGIKNATIIWWAGLRGSLSMVMALSISDDAPFKQVFIAMTFGVVVLSVVFQGTTIQLFLRWLDMMPSYTSSAIFLSKSLAQIRAIRAQIEAVLRLHAQDFPEAKILIVNLKFEQTKILNKLKEQYKNPDFQEAIKDRLSAIQCQLKQIARVSYRESMESNLLTENEIEQLINQLEK